MDFSHSHCTSEMVLTVKERQEDTDTFKCLTKEGYEVLVDLHSGATTNPLNLDNIIGKKIWVEWLQPYEWIAQAPRVLPDERKEGAA